MDQFELEFKFLKWNDKLNVWENSKGKYFEETKLKNGSRGLKEVSLFDIRFLKEDIKNEYN